MLHASGVRRVSVSSKAARAGTRRAPFRPQPMRDGTRAAAVGSATSPPPLRQAALQKARAAQSPAESPRGACLRPVQRFATATRRPTKAFARRFVDTDRVIRPPSTADERRISSGKRNDVGKRCHSPTEIDRCCSEGRKRRRAIPIMASATRKPPFPLPCFNPLIKQKRRDGAANPPVDPAELPSPSGRSPFWGLFAPSRCAAKSNRSVPDRRTRHLPNHAHTPTCAHCAARMASIRRTA